MKNLVYLSLFFSLLFLNCSEDKDDNIVNQNDLENLPVDTGGEQTANVLGSTNAIYGHYIYTPSDYNSNSPDYPLLIFLHGSGQVGNSQNNADVLKNVFYTGLPSLIEQKKWSPKYPMIVASPQLTSGSWNADDVHNFIKYIIDNYNINTNRIYLTGYSLGAYGCFTYISKYGADSYATAIVPIAGGGDTGSGSQYTSVAVWAFHGDSDTSVPTSRSLDMVSAINAANPSTKAKVTIYPGVAHNSDTRTFDGTGMGTESSDYDAFNMSIFDWMLLHEK
ncbi:dienelactone hydrolase family protein [Mariniflexile fucanivorans]|uniref:Dienelactone hydrolase family protein n=1 Tax=Mariniflexile fucanivorans TaxID=264023 RepID=A0A4R1RHN8_9FLAO|nr:dienelactone hydrolase family protein [Mariniflexile fucanivorans]TCL65449.1 dienelactone hydrolase family protein [Mariniflexile fucanivorans]